MPAGEKVGATDVEAMSQRHSLSAVHVAQGRAPELEVLLLPRALEGGLARFRARGEGLCSGSELQTEVTEVLQHDAALGTESPGSEASSGAGEAGGTEKRPAAMAMKQLDDSPPRSEIEEVADGPPTHLPAAGSSRCKAEEGEHCTAAHVAGAIAAEPPVPVNLAERRSCLSLEMSPTSTERGQVLKSWDLTPGSSIHSSDESLARLPAKVPQRDYSEMETEVRLEDGTWSPMSSWKRSSKPPTEWAKGEAQSKEVDVEPKRRSAPQRAGTSRFVLAVQGTKGIQWRFADNGGAWLTEGEGSLTWGEDETRPDAFAAASLKECAMDVSSPEKAGGIKWWFGKASGVWIKQFARHFPPGHNLHVGDRLIAINDIWIKDLDRPSIEACWRSEQKMGRTLRLSFALAEAPGAGGRLVAINGTDVHLAPRTVIEELWAAAQAAGPLLELDIAATGEE